MQNLFLKIVTWLVLEIALNLLGIDDLADYGEFISEKNIATFSHYSQPRACHQLVI